MNDMMLGSKHANLMDVLRTSKLLPKVVICINIIRYTHQVYRACFDPDIMICVIGGLLHDASAIIKLYTQGCR